jgi:osmotically-inducible protein OsmY
MAPFRPTRAASARKARKARTARAPTGRAATPAGTYADREAHERYNRAHFPQGPHRGKGPKGFTRSDERLKEHVNELLMEHAEIDATHVEVEVHSGVVSVAGTVEDRQQRRAIEDLIEGIFGVTEVQISIKLANRASSRLLIHARDRGV